uniref:G protein-coupled receptor n=1 Tax=Pristionchus pacificus TaxID=54126 RepID=A0A8R1US36_PRIPA
MGLLAIVDIFQTFCISIILLIIYFFASLVYFKLLFFLPFSRNYTFKLIVFNGTVNLLSCTMHLVVYQLTTYPNMYTFYLYLKDHNFYNITEFQELFLHFPAVLDAFPVTKIVDLFTFAPLVLFECNLGDGQILIPITMFSNNSKSVKLRQSYCFIRYSQLSQRSIVSCTTLLVNFRIASYLIRERKHIKLAPRFRRLCSVIKPTFQKFQKSSRAWPNDKQHSILCILHALPYQYGGLLTISLWECAPLPICLFSS